MSMLVKSKMLLKTLDFMSVIGKQELTSIMRDASDISSNDEVTLISFNYENHNRSDYQFLVNTICSFDFFHIVEVSEDNQVKDLYRFLNEEDESLFLNYGIGCQISIVVNNDKELPFKWRKDCFNSTLTSEVIKLRKGILKMYLPIGSRIQLVKTANEEARLYAGLKGTVIGYDDLPSVMVKWDNGSSLKLLPFEGDKFITL